MAQKKSKKRSTKSNEPSPLGTIGTVLFEVLRGFFDQLTERLQEVTYYTEKKLMQKISSGILMIASIIFICIAIVILISEYLDLNKGWSYLIVGLLLLVIALVLNYNFENTKYTR